VWAVSAKGCILGNLNLLAYLSSEAPRRNSRSFTVLLVTASGLRAMIQVRRVARQVRTAAERELTQRAEALNNRLLVGHYISPKNCVVWIPFTRQRVPGRRLLSLLEPCRGAPGVHLAQPAPERLKPA
jgi:hypothetical protein